MRYESKTKADLIKEIKSLRRKVHSLEKGNHEHNGKTEIAYKSGLSRKQKTKSEFITESKSSKAKINSKNIDDKFLNALEQLKVHDHLCLIYEKKEEQFAAVIPFIRIGLERGEKCVYIVDDNTAAMVKNAMRKEGIDVVAAIKKNALAIITKKEAYLKQGYFDPDWMIAFLKKTAEEAKASGFSVLRATGEMTWILGGEPGVDRIIEYESKLNYFFPVSDVLAICQYNKKRFSPEIIRDVISTHPLIVFGKTVCKNFYYVPPDEFLAPLKRRTYSEVDRLLKNILEREKAESLLEESELRFRLLYERAPIAYQSLDSEGKILEINNAWLNQLGYTYEEVIGHSISEFLVPDQIKLLQERFPKFLASGEVHNAEFNFNRKDGNTITLEVEGRIGYDTQGKFKQTHCVLYNITERKLHEQAIEKLNRIYRVLSETNQLIVREKDRNRLFEGICQIIVEHGQLLMAAVSFVDYSTNKVIPHTWYGKEDGYFSEITITINDEPLGRGPTGRAVREKKSVFSTDISSEPMMQPWRKPALQRGYMSSAAFPIVENNTVIGTITVFAAKTAYFKEKELELLDELAMDVSYALENIKIEEERKHAEDEILKRTRLLEALFTNHITCFVLLDKDFNFIRVNEAYARACARDVSDFPGHNHFEFYPSDAQIIFEDVVRTKKPFQVAARPFVFEDHPDWGTTYWDWTLVPILDGNGEVEFLVFSLNDVTERVTTEHELQTSNDQLRQVFDNIDAVVFSLDLTKRKLLKISKACEKIYGIKQEEFYKNPNIWMTIIHPDDLPSVQANFLSLTENKKAGSEIEYRIIRHDGETRWIRNTTKSIADENGKAVRIDGISYDITERKLAEEAIHKSEDRYRDLVENSTDLICTHDLEGRILTANPAASRLLGYDLNSLLSMNIQDIIAPELKHEFESYISTIRTKGLGSGLMVVQTKSGEKRIWQYNNTLRTEGVDKPIVRGMAQDITERKKAEREIRRLSEALEQSPVSVVIADADANIEYVNKTFEETTGYTFAEVIHHNPKIIQSGLTPKETYKDFWDTIKSGRIWKGEFLNKRKNGELFWESEVIKPILDKNNRIINYLAVKQDVTEKKKMTEELIAAKDRAEKSDKLKTEFLQQMSHEIRSPMNVAISLTNLIKDEVRDKVEPEILEYFEGINLAGKRLIRTVDLILNTSEMYVGTYEPTFSTIDIFEEVLKHLKVEFSTVASKKELDFFLSCNVEKPRVKCDKYSVTQVFGNLIDNAIKYTQQGKVEIIVDKNSSQNVFVTVADSGIGISYEFMEKLFEPFTQEERGYSRRYEGNGLGLALVKKYCDLNNIRITVKSEKGKGSSFTLEFFNTISN